MIESGEQAPPDDVADALWDLDELLETRSPGAVGQVESMLTRAVQAAVKLGKLGETDLGLLGGALAGARSLDIALRLPSIKGGYLVAQLLTPYREVCQALGIPEAVSPADAPEARPAGERQQDDPDWFRDTFGTPE